MVINFFSRANIKIKKKKKKKVTNKLWLNHIHQEIDTEMLSKTTRFDICKRFFGQVFG